MLAALSRIIFPEELQHCHNCADIPYLCIKIDVNDKLRNAYIKQWLKGNCPSG